MEKEIFLLEENFQYRLFLLVKGICRTRFFACCSTRQWSSTCANCVAVVLVTKELTPSMTFEVFWQGFVED